MTRFPRSVADPLEERVAAETVRERLFGIRADPVSIGRYAVRRLVGEGALGVVYAAYDPELDREVAVKFVRSDQFDGGAEDEGARRLIREARAAAKLSHPNVVHVYDVGVAQGRVFFAMELVEGVSLRQWMDDAPRSWREVVVLFAAAAGGMAAAHALGIVHRDFKPDNVLVDPTGTPKVADFGIARLVPGDPTAPRPPDAGPRPGARESDAADVDITATGTLLGTPAYMAPELFAGAAASERSDQFAFCVALHEALHGVRPFAGRNISELTASLTAGRRADAKPPAGLPRRVRAALERGLALKPAMRHPSMDELAAELQRAVGSRRWRTVLLASSGVGAAAAVALALATEPVVCDGAEAQLNGVWDADVRASLVRALGPAGTGEAWTSLEREIDAHAARWVEAYAAACEATQRGEQSAETLDQAMVCLSRHRRVFQASLDLILEPDAASRAAQIVGDLAPISECRDTEALARRKALRPPPELEADVDALADRMAEFEPLWAASLYERGLALARELLIDAERIGFSPQIARARFWVAHFLDDVGRPSESLPLAVATLDEAIASGDDELAARSAWLLAVLHGGSLDDLEEAERNFRIAHAFGRRVGYEGTLLQAKFWNSEGWVRRMYAQPRRAMALTRQALEIRAQVRGARSIDAAQSHGNLSGQALAAQEYYTALEHATLAREIYRETFGEQHPDTAMAAGNLAMALAHLGRVEEALAETRRVTSVLEETMGADHAWVQTGYLQAAGLLHRLDRREEGRKDLEHVIATAERTGRDHLPEYANALQMLAGDAAHEGRYDDAERLLRRSVDVLARLNPEHPEQGLPLIVMGDVALRKGERAAAEKHLRRAVEVLSGPDAGRLIDLARAQVGLAHALGPGAEGAASARAALRTLGEADNPTAPVWQGTFRDAHAWLAAHAR